MSRGEESQIARMQRGRATSPMGVSDAAIEQAVARYLDRYIKQILGDYSQLQEKVAVLNGERGSSGNYAARLSMLQQIVEVVPAEPASRAAAGATPTKEEFDALIADVHALFAGIAGLRFLLSRQS